MTKTTLFNIGIVIAVVFIVVVVVPYVLIFASYPSLSNQWENHTWTNEQYHIINDKYEWGGSCPPDGVCRAPDESELGTAFWPVMVMCVIALIVTFVIVLFIPVPINTEKYELFDRWDDRV